MTHERDQLFNQACNQAKGELWNLVARIERDCNLTGTQSALVVARILESMPTVFTPHGLQAYIDSAKDSSRDMWEG